MRRKDKLTYFIVSYGKADDIPTLRLLHRYGITDPVYVVVGEDDPQLEAYKAHTDYRTLVFRKDDYYDKVDSLGSYNTTHKVCTYARAFIDEYAKEHGIRYVCFLFDDIMSVQLRYLGKDDKIHSCRKFNLSKALNCYLKLLCSSKNLYLVGPPCSSYYIGINKNVIDRPASHYGNMFIYDTEKPIGPYKASVLEDMTIVLYNNAVGHLCLCPFGLQVNCREPLATGDCYAGVTRSEYVQHHVILTNGTPQSYDRLSIPYRKFSPMVLSGRYKKS